MIRPNNSNAMSPYYKAILFIVCVLLSFPIYAYDFKVGGLCYNILSESNKTVELTWEAIQTPYTGNVVVPSQVSFNGITYDVVEIGEWAMVNIHSTSNNGVEGYYRNSKLYTVSLPPTIVVIRSSAFRGCSGLTFITIPNSVTSIGEMAFSHCI